jgi:hypothetical protein
MLAQAEELTCSAKGGKNCIGAPMGNASCAERGFDTLRLSCGTCRQLGQHLEQLGTSGKEVLGECLSCCREAAAVERFSSARLTADANIQERDQDLHDFIKRKAPLFPQLEVEYMEAAEAAVEFENDDDPNRVVRVVVTGWKSDHLSQLLGVRLEQTKPNSSDVDKDGVVMAAQGAYTAEVQTCSG